MHGKAFGGFGIEEIRIVLDNPGNPIVEAQQCKEEIELCPVIVSSPGGDRHSGERKVHGLFEGEAHLENRVDARYVLRLQRVQNRFERQFLICFGQRHLGVYLLQEIRERYGRFHP